MNLRKIIYWLVVVGIIGLIAELILLEHYDSWTQWIPLVSLGVGLASTATVSLKPSLQNLRVFQAVMFLFAVAGVAGLFLHFKGNIEWMLERDPDMGGWKLIWEALRGATPTLAPGALAQLGLLGLAWSYRHPAFDLQNKAKETA